MVRQGVAGLWLLLLAVPLVHVNARGKLHLGSVSVNSDGAVGSQIIRHERDYEEDKSPGLEKLLHKLGLKDSSTQSEDRDTEVEGHTEMETEQGEEPNKWTKEDDEERQRDAAEGERLQEEYERRESEPKHGFRLGDSEKPFHPSRSAEDQDYGDESRTRNTVQEDYGRRRQEDDVEDISPPAFTHKRRHSSEDYDPEPAREDELGRTHADDDTLI
jgi:hypothetical protein